MKPRFLYSAWRCSLVLVISCFSGGYTELEDFTPPVTRYSDIRFLHRHKRSLLSVLLYHDLDLPLPGTVTSVLQVVSSELDVFHVSPKSGDSTALTAFANAFSNYRFSLILDGFTDGRINPAVVHAIWAHTVPVYNGFFEFSSMFTNGVAAWNQENFSLSELQGRLSELNQHIKFMWSYQRILQEVIWYRYGHRVTDRTHYIETISAAADSKNLAIMGVYSAQRNSAFRRVIRETWGRKLVSLGIELLFFLSESKEDELIASEAARHGDIVQLPVQEGYKYNSRKGLLFLRWIAEYRSGFKFLIKADDDVFFRPLELIHHLTRTKPAGYVWGFIDYISPVPKSPDSPFFNPPELYPFPTFPTYPRGVLRVVSMDIVESIAKAADEGSLRMIYGDDPCFGVHLRQVAESRVKSVVIDDFASYTRFAMEPTCGKSWSSVTNETWIVHHVKPEEILCLWKSELEGLFPDCKCL